jgi:hypothetical protein
MVAVVRWQEWGGRWSSFGPSAVQGTVSEVFLHHSAGSHPDDPRLATRELNELAINERGHTAIDYSMVVHRNAATGAVTILEGRGVHQPAATRDRNSVSKSIVLLGYFHSGNPLSRQPTDGELRGVADAMRFMQAQGWVANTGWTLLGHRDNPARPGATVCPGDLLYPKMATIRQMVSAGADVLPNPLGTFTRAIRLGDRTAATGTVGSWQRFLRLYVDGTVAIDGDFGAQTDRVTRRFQASKGLAVDGLVGRITWDAGRAEQLRR